MIEINEVVETGFWWFGWARRGRDGGRRPESRALRVVGEVAEVEICKVEFGRAFRGCVQGYVFTGIDLAEVVGMPVVREVSAGGKGFHHKVSRIDDGSVVLVQAALLGW